MVEAAWDTSNLAALTKDGVQCETCCAPLPDPNTMPSECGDCAVTQPLALRLSFSGFTDANPTVCTFAGGVGQSKFSGGTAAVLNGNSFILPHVSGCSYRLDIDVGITYPLWEGGGACVDPESPGSPFTNTFMRFQAVDIGTGVQVSIMYLPVRQLVIFTGVIPYTGGDVCFDTANTVNNTLIGGPCSLEGLSVVLPATGIVGIDI